jgi:hypothetical protein
MVYLFVSIACSRSLSLVIDDFENLQEFIEQDIEQQVREQVRNQVVSALV